MEWCHKWIKFSSGNGIIWLSLSYSLLMGKLCKFSNLCILCICGQQFASYSLCIDILYHFHLVFLFSRVLVRLNTFWSNYSQDSSSRILTFQQITMPSFQALARTVFPLNGNDLLWVDLSSSMSWLECTTWWNFSGLLLRVRGDAQFRGIFTYRIHRFYLQSFKESTKVICALHIPGTLVHLFIVRFLVE